jgi:hypothetical protein
MVPVLSGCAEVADCMASPASMPAREMPVTEKVAL